MLAKQPLLPENIKGTIASALMIFRINLHPAVTINEMVSILQLSSLHLSKWFDTRDERWSFIGIVVYVHASARTVGLAF